MAVVTRKGPPDLMITFAANPAWPEIVANLLPGQTGMDRPDLVNRVFKIKLRELLKDLKSNVFTKQLYGMYVCEYQARGLVHAHIKSSSMGTARSEVMRSTSGFGQTYQTSPSPMESSEKK